MHNIEEIKLLTTSTIKDALMIIDDGAIKIALVVDSCDKLIGTLTDGDIRRGFLNGKTLNDTIEDIYFTEPSVVNVNSTKEEIIELYYEAL